MVVLPSVGRSAKGMPSREEYVALSDGVILVQLEDRIESGVTTDDKVGILTLLQRSRVEVVAGAGSMILA